MLPFCTVLASLLIVGISGYNNGLGTVPPRGWSTWCTDDLCGLLDYCFEEEVHQVADAMVSSGMLAAGYNLILLDDCWASTERDSNDNIQPDPSRFPSGIPALVDYVHSRGLRLGLYTDAGPTTCKYNRTGSGGHYAQDAATFTNWTVDYVKMDYCDAPSSPPECYGEFSAALNATGHATWFATCDWGVDSPWEWAPAIAQSYREGPDHLPLWEFPGEQSPPGGQGVIDIINSFANTNNYSSVYGWADPDFLMTGLILSDAESQTEFSFWAFFGGSMIVATDVRNMTPWKASVLLNTDLLSINNDTLNAPGYRVANSTAQNTQVWAKPLANGDMAVALLNANDWVTQPVTVFWTSLGWPNAANVSIYDCWQHEEVGFFTAGYSTTISTHSTGVYRLTRVS